MTNKQFIKKYADKDGNIDLSNKTLDSFPDNLDLEGNLSLKNSIIANLPKKLSVMGNLDLRNAKIENFSKELWVRSNLDLRGAIIKNPAQQITIWGNFSLSKNTKLTKLADSLQVLGECDVPLSLYVLLATHLEVGNLDISCDPTHSLPKSLYISENLVILPSHLKKLPKELKIQGSFIVKNTTIPFLPQDLIIGKDFRHNEEYDWENQKKYFKKIYQYLLKLEKTYNEKPVNHFNTAKSKKNNPHYKLPSLDLLPAKNSNKMLVHTRSLHLQAQIIIRALVMHGLVCEICRIMPEAFTSIFELRCINKNLHHNFSQLEEELDYGFSQLEDELVKALELEKVKITKKRGWDNVLNIEVWHKYKREISLRELHENESYPQSKSALSFPLGKDTRDLTYFVNLSTMPHLLVAGETRHEVTHLLDTILLSLVYKSNPSELEVLIIDTQNRAFEPYKNLPHLVQHLPQPIIHDKEKIEYSLIWLLEEMERRTQLLEEFEAKNISSYNIRIGISTQAKHRKLPYLVCILSDLNDLLDSHKIKLEVLLYNLYEQAQKVGIHLILASSSVNKNQPPEFIEKCGLMKVALQSKESKFPYISEAKELLGKNDMLLKGKSSWLETFYGATISAEEVEKVVDFWAKQ